MDVRLHEHRWCHSDNKDQTRGKHGSKLKESSKKINANIHYLTQDYFVRQKLNPRIAKSWFVICQLKECQKSSQEEVVPSFNFWKFWILNKQQYKSFATSKN